VIKKGGGRFRVKLPVFDDTFFVHYGEAGRKTMEAWRAANGAKPMAQRAIGHTYGNSFWVRDIRHDERTRAHEIYHCVKAMAEEKGIDDDETEAYLIGWLTAEVKKRIKGRK